MGPEQKAFFVKSAAAAVDGRGAAPDSTYLAALRLILQKAGQLSGSQIARINPAEADRMFGLRPQEAPPNLPIRSSFPSANSPRAGDGVLVNPGAPDMQFPRHTGSGRRTENLSPPHMEAERPKLRGERGGSGQPQPLGSTLSADDIRRIASGLVSGHAFDKHFHEFQDLGITTPEQLHAHVSNVLANMGLTSQTKVVDGKRLVYDPDSNTILIFHSQTGNAVTMFRPENGARYYYDMGKKK
ncbi:MAG: hypothetical protein MEP57_07380 [Microvirga sp.]|nr:hypothetical protein [Microvirga sp.]